MFTASEDGYVKWWDIRLKLKKNTLFHLDFDRNINEPIRKFLLNVDESDTDPEKSEAATCLAYEPTMPSRVISILPNSLFTYLLPLLPQFLVGTRRGKVLGCRMSPKQGSSNMILGVYDDLKKSRVLAVDRNSFYPKNFLIVRYS